ncbi:hypothetical protein WDU94_012879 [Cyamophila willieti]
MKGELEKCLEKLEAGSPNHSSLCSTTTDTFVLSPHGLNSTEDDESNATTTVDIADDWKTTLVKLSSKFIPFSNNNRLEPSPYTVVLEQGFDTSCMEPQKRLNHLSQHRKSENCPLKSYKETNSHSNRCYQQANNAESTSCFGEKYHSHFKSTNESQLKAIKFNKKTFHKTRSKSVRQTKKMQGIIYKRHDSFDHLKIKRGTENGGSRKIWTKTLLKGHNDSISSTNVLSNFGIYNKISGGKKVENKYILGKYKLKVLQNIVKKDILGENATYLQTPINSDLSSTAPNFDLQESFKSMQSRLNNKKHGPSFDLFGSQKSKLNEFPKNRSQRDSTYNSAKQMFMNPFFDKETISSQYNQECQIQSCSKQSYVVNNNLKNVPGKIQVSKKEELNETVNSSKYVEKNKRLDQKGSNELFLRQKYFTPPTKSYDPYLLQSKETQRTLTIGNQGVDKQLMKVRLTRDEKLKYGHEKYKSCTTKQNITESKKIDPGSLSQKYETSKTKDRKVCNTLNVKGQFLVLKCRSEPCQTKGKIEEHASGEEYLENTSQSEEKNVEKIENSHSTQNLDPRTCSGEHNLKYIDIYQPTQLQKTNESYTQTSRELLMRKIDELIRPIMKEDKKHDKEDGNVMDQKGGTHTLLRSLKTLNSTGMKSIILENLHPNVTKVDEINNNNEKCDGGEDDIFKSYCDVYYVNKARNFQRKKVSSLEKKKKVRSNPRDDIFNEINCQTIYRNRARFYERDISDIHIK